MPHMHIFKTFLALALLLALSMNSHFTPDSMAQESKSPEAAPQKRKIAETVLFLIKRSDEKNTGAGFVTEPIALKFRSQFVMPPDKNLDPADESLEEEFIKRYYGTKGDQRTHRLLFGGGEIGTVTTKGSRLLRAAQDCIALGTDVRVNTKINFAANEMALATNSPTLGQGKSLRRAATSQERVAVTRSAREFLKARGVKPNALSRIAPTSLAAADLNDDGKWELIAGFDVAEDTKNDLNWHHYLFFVLEPRGLDYQRYMLNYSRITPDMQGSDYRFADILDLDGDGVAEIFAEAKTTEGRGHIIYQKTKNKWRVIYDRAINCIG